jgi:hypothetical protein
MGKPARDGLDLQVARRTFENLSLRRLRGKQQQRRANASKNHVRLRPPP